MAKTHDDNRLQTNDIPDKSGGIDGTVAKDESNFDDSSCITFLLNGRTQILKASNQAQRLLHTPEETLLNSTLLSYINNEYKIKFHHHIHQVLCSKKEKTCQVEFINMQGEKIKLSLKSQRYYDEDQKVYLAKTTVCNNSEENIPLEKNPELRNERIHLLFEHFSEGVFCCNDEGTITYCNQSLKNILNEDITNAFWYEKLLGVTKYTNFIDKAEEERIVNHKPTGKVLLITENQLPKEYNNLKFTIVRDITPFISRENSILNRQKLKAEESDRLQSAFLSNLSHEIRTPLNGIMGFSEIIEKLNITEEKRHEYLRIIRRSSKQLLGVIEDILDISKIESNQITAHPGLFNINELLDDLYRIYRDHAKNPKVLDITVQKGLENTEAYIKTDESLLKRIFISLLDNAIKFTETGSVIFGYDSEKEHLKFFVKDTGIGIDEKYKYDIFEHFKQIEEAETREYGGTGLGLTIAKSFVELLDGTIWVESKLNKGANFYFTLPHKTQTGKPKVKKKLQFENAWRNLTILIVEDSEDIHTYIKEIFEETRANFLSAFNGQQAIDIIASTPVDVILLDLQMPKMDGLETCKRIKKRNPGKPVIIQTAYLEPKEVEKAKQLGCDELITKPIDSNKLFSIISKHLKIT